MDLLSVRKSLRQRLGGIRGKRWVDRTFSPMPFEAVVPLEQARDVLLLCSRMISRFDSQLGVQELAHAHELANRGREFAITHDPRIVFGKSVIWFLPNHLVWPRLWDYSRQVQEFVSGMEGQGNRMLCSSDELAYWENKATMHQRFRELSVPTPETRILTGETRDSVEFDFEPVLLKEEHSAGSEGIHYFATAREAREFVKTRQFWPRESLIMQEVVPGATKDLRLTMIGDQMIRSATFWRKKSPDALSKSRWTTTASKYGSAIEHENIPEEVVPVVAGYLRRLGLRKAGIDLMWVDDDVSRSPLVLEVSPYFQPNPPKPERYAHLSYSQYKKRPYAKDGYLQQQYGVFREMAASLLDQQLY
jgi:ATP-grasp domain-containing protein